MRTHIVAQTSPVHYHPAIPRYESACVCCWFVEFEREKENAARHNIMHAHHQTRVTNTRSGGCLSCVLVCAFFRKVVLSETTPNVFFYSYTTNFTKIEATPMRHDFLFELFEST